MKAFAPPQQLVEGHRKWRKYMEWLPTLADRVTGSFSVVATRTYQTVPTDFVIFLPHLVER